MGCVLWDYIFGVGVLLGFVYIILSIIEKIKNMRKGR